MKESINNILSLIQRLFGREKETGSSKEALRRLRLVLISDRSNIAPQLLQTLKEDLINVISKYIEIDATGLEVFLEKGDTSIALTASMPVKRVRRTKGLKPKLPPKEG